MGLFVLNSLVLVHLTNSNLALANRKLYQSKSERINQYLTDFFFNQLFRVVFDEILSYRNSSVNQFMLYGHPGTWLPGINQSVNTIVLGNEWLKYILIYREGIPYVMDSGLSRQIRSDSVHMMLLDGMRDFVLASKKAAGWILMKDGLEAVEPTAAYFVKYPITNPARNRGFILFFIDTAAVNRKIARFIDTKNETAILVDRYGNFLFHSGQQNVPAWIPGAEYGTSGPEISFWSDRKSQWLVTWQTIPTDEQFSLALIIPSSRIRRQLLYSQRITLFFVVFFMTIIITYILFIIVHVQPPISSIMYMLDKVVVRSEPYQKKRFSLPEPERIEKVGRELVAHQFVIDMITVGFEIPHFEEICRMLGIGNYHAPLYVITAEQNHALFRNKSWQEKERMQTGFYKFWRTLFPANRSITIKYPAGNLICLFFTWRNTEKEFYPKFKSIITEYECNISFAGPIADRQRIPQVYHQLIRTLDRKFYQGYGNIFLPEDIGKNQKEFFCQIAPFRKLLMSERYAEFLELVTREIRRQGNSRISPIIFRDFLIKIVELFVEIHTRKGGTSASFSYGRMRDELEDLTTTPEILVWIRDMTGQLEIALRRTTDVTGGHKFLFEQVQNYMKDSFDRNISQKTVAEHFSISSGFLSKLFHEFYPGGFGQYLKEIKMNEAEKQILENNVRSVQNLAHSLGYSSVVYFSRQFKQVFGILPGEYMKNRMVKGLI